MIIKSNGCLESYYEGCFNGKYVVGQELKDELVRLMDDLVGTDYVYDTTEADRRMFFMETCIRLTKSPFYGKPMVLMEWQKAFISALYGFKLPNGRMRFQKALLLIARKNAKSETCSALLLTDLILGGEGRDIVCSSNDDSQADILYHACDTMRLMIDPRSRDTWRSMKWIRCQANDNRIFKLSDRTRNKEGRNIDLAVIDEVHEMKENVIVKSIEQSQSLKDDPLLVLITTEGFVNDGFLDEELRRARAIISDEIDDNASKRYLPWLYTQDSENEVWQGTRENRLWMKSNPSLGDVKKWAYLEQQIDLARSSKADRAFVLAKDFNIKQSNSEAWLMLEDYDYESTFDISDVTNHFYLGGVDLAETTDLSCAKAMVMLPDDNTKYVITKYFMPEGKLQRSDDRSGGARYEQWAREGYLMICPGNYLDVSVIADWYMSLYRDYGLKPYAVGYDAKFAVGFIQRMDEYGFEVEGVWQHPEVMDNAIKMLETDLRSKLVIGNTPLDRWCYGNASLKVDSRGLGLLAKIDGLGSRRIDGAVATAIAWEVYRRHRTDYERILDRD